MGPCKFFKKRESKYKYTYRVKTNYPYKGQKCHICNFKNQALILLHILNTNIISRFAADISYEIA